jgi:hypothetical protein
VGSGNNVAVGGFIITGTTPKKVVIRGLGPSLTEKGISNVLADPTLDLRNSAMSSVFTNDNWRDAQQSQIEGTALQPTDDLEAMIVVTLDPGAYTAILAGKNGGTGVGLIEIYAADATNTSELANISTRGLVRTGENVMIGGFILGGDAQNTGMVIRGLGPSLTAFGISNALVDPTLEVHDENGAPVVANDNWADDPVSVGELTTRLVAPTSSLEAAIYTTLSPGMYTAILAGKNGEVGVGLVEIYNVH